MESGRAVWSRSLRDLVERTRALRLPKIVVLIAAPALALGALGVALATEFSYTERGDGATSWWGFALAAVLLALSAAVLALRRRDVEGVSTADTRDESPPEVTRVAEGFVLSRRWEFGLLAAVMLLAAFFRLWRFYSFPQGLWYDEAVNGSDAVYILDVEHFTVWRETVQGRSTLYLYLLAGAFKVFGFNLFAFRIVPVMAGLAAVFAFYFLARWLVGQVPALIATALFACGRWATTFSRISWEASLVPLLATMSAFFLVRALETRNRFYYFMAGGSLAAGLYTHVSFRIVPVAMAFVLLYVLVTNRRLIWRNAPGIVLYAAAFAVVIFPLAQFAATHRDQVSERTRAVNVFREVDEKNSWEPLKFNLRASVRMMNVAGDRNGRHNLNDKRVVDGVAFGAPMLDEVTAALFVLGLAVSLWSLRDWRRGMVGGWYVLALVPGALTLQIENPSGIRDIGALPPVYLLVGLAVASVYRTLAPTRAGLYAFGAVAALLVGGSVAINYYDLFERQAKDEYVYDGFTPEFTQIGEQISEHGHDERFLISREFSSHPAIHVLGKGVPFGEFTPASNINLPDGDKSLVLITDERSLSIVPELRRLYPNVTQDDHVDPYGRIFWSKITVPLEDIRALHEVPVTVTRNGVPVDGAPAKTRLNHAWTEEDLAGGPIDVTWSGFFWAGANITDFNFNFSAPWLAAVVVDGVEKTGAGQLTMTSHLPPGEHTVQVRAHIDTPGALALQVAPIGPGMPGGADAIYGQTAMDGDHGFRAVYREGEDFGAQPVAITKMPFAVPADGFGEARLVEYQAVFNAPTSGKYGFAIDGWNSPQLFVDDQLVVDNGGSHEARRAEGAVDLDAGQHLVSIQYIASGHPMWSLYTADVSGTWSRAYGSEFRVPPEDYKPPATVRLEVDETWGAAGRSYPELGKVRSVALTPGGDLVAASTDKVAIIHADGTLDHVFNTAAGEIADIGVGASGEIAVLDRRSNTLFVYQPDGTLQRKVEGKITSVGGMLVVGDRAIIAAPAGGFVFRLPLLEDGEPESLPFASPETPNRALQPSDVAQAADGTYYITDFEKRTIIVSSDGATVTKTFPGVTGGGPQLPRLAVYRGLLFESDPTGSRIVTIDRATGRQRGAALFSQAGVVRPLGLAVTPDGLLYMADFEKGLVFRLTISGPPELIGQ